MIVILPLDQGEERGSRNMDYGSISQTLMSEQGVRI